MEGANRTNKIYCLAIHARLHLAGKNHKSEATLAKEMLQDILGWLISAFFRRWSIEVAFKSSKQVMQIQAPQHWCRQSIEKLSPWVWLMQSVVSLWYITDGRKLPSARAACRRFGEWDTEWLLVHMLRILRTALLEDTIRPKSATKTDLYQLLDHLENYLHLAT